MKQNIIIYLQEERTVAGDLFEVLQKLLMSNFPNENVSVAIGKLFKGQKVIYVGQMYLEGEDVNYIIMSYPKYLPLPTDLHQFIVEGKEIPREYQEAIKIVKKELFLVCKVIEFAEKSIYDESGDFSSRNRKDYSKSVTQISVAEYLLKDYVQQGKYIFTEFLERVNGNGPINWMATMNRSVPLLQDNKIVYTDFVNNCEEENDQSFISVAYAYAILNAYKLFGEILGYSRADIPDMDREDFNEVHAVKYLKGYLSQMFDGRGYMIVKALCAWYESRSEYRVNYFGTNCFEKIWEVVCQKVFNNDESIWQGNMQLPRWTMINSDNKLESYYKSDAISLQPDITCIFEKNFMILDEKYYNPSFKEDHTCEGVPATSDVTKQINYYEQLKACYGNSYRYLNAFLIPLYANTCDWLLKYSGYIKLEHATRLINRIRSRNFEVPKEKVEEGDVRVFSINTTKVYKEFLDGAEEFEIIVNLLMDAEIVGSCV